MQYIEDPDLIMIREINARRQAERNEAVRQSVERVKHERERKAFWALFRKAVIECGSCLCIVAMMGVYTARGLVSPQVSGPIALACVAVGVWMGCQYWQILNK